MPPVLMKSRKRESAATNGEGVTIEGHGVISGGFRTEREDKRVLMKISQMTRVLESFKNGNRKES